MIESIRSRLALAALAALALVGPAQAQALRHGHVEFRWGDAAAGLAGPRQPELYLADDFGGRERVDLDAARRVVDNLYALSGREVEMTLAPAPQPGGRLVPTAIDLPAGVDSTNAPRVAGAQPWVTLLCRFPDVGGADQKPPSYFTGMLSNSPGRLDDYWRQVSYNKVNLVGSKVAGWFTLPYPRAHYVVTTNGAGKANLDALWADCTGVANAQVDFRPFAGINTMYNADLDCCAWGGGHYATLDGVSKVWYSTWEPPWGFANEAPLAHEMGHGFGLPHANNSDLDDDVYDNPWDLMSDSWDNAAHDPTYGAQPKHISIWSRAHLGWIDAARETVIASNGNVGGIVLDRASLLGSSNVQMVKITLPATAPATHYYVIEARKRVAGFDSALAGDAVIVHEVDENRDEPAWCVDAAVPPATISNNPGSMFVVGESWTAPGSAFKVSVTAATSNGFVISVQRGPVVDTIFRSGFDLP